MRKKNKYKLVRPGQRLTVAVNTLILAGFLGTALIAQRLAWPADEPSMARSMIATSVKR